MLDQVALVLNLDGSSIDVHLLLNGSANPDVNNLMLFRLVQEYIVNTKRFM